MRQISHLCLRALSVGSISNVVAVNPSLFEVTVGPVTGEGTLRLNLNASGTGIADHAGNAIVGGFTTGQIYNRILQGNGTWTRPTSGGLWGDQANWISGIIGGGINNTADFSTLEITEDVQVHLDSPRVIGNLIFGDSDIATPGELDHWQQRKRGQHSDAGNVCGSAINTREPVGSEFVCADQCRTRAESLASTKSDQGTLILSGANTLNGALNVTAGTVRLEGGGLTSTTVAMAAGGGRLNIAGGTFTATGALTVNAGGGSALIVDAGTATFTSLATNNVAGGLLRVSTEARSTQRASICREAVTALQVSRQVLLSQAGRQRSPTRLVLGQTTPGAQCRLKEDH